MTKFQEQLLGWKDKHENTLEQSRLSLDFPEILEKDGKFANAIYDGIYGNMDWDSTESEHCLVRVENEVANYNFGFLETKLDLPTYFALQLTVLYDSYIPNDGKYKREEVLDKASSTLQEILVFLHKHLQQTGGRALLESHSLVLAHRGDFGGQAVDKARKRLDKTFKIKFPPGRKRTPLDKSVKQAAIGLYSELMAVLAPDFDGESEYKKSKVCKDVVRQYKGELKLRYEIAVQKLALKVYNHKKSKSAAVFLIAKMLPKSERQIRRYLSDKQLPRSGD